jgi:hypothetical protein
MPYLIYGLHTFKGAGTHDELVSTTGKNGWFLKNVAHAGAQALNVEKENRKAEGLSFCKLAMGIDCSGVVNFRTRFSLTANLWVRMFAI